MKKVAAVTFTLAVVAVGAYAGSAWYVGKQVETSIEKQYGLLKSQPYLKIAKRDYQRGVFSSEETLVLELSEILDDDPIVKELGPLQVTLHTKIQHGPFAGSQMAGAVANSELVLSDGLQKRLAVVSQSAADFKPLTIHTVYDFSGGGASTFQSSPVEFSISDDTLEMQISWQGFEGTASFAPNMKHYTSAVHAPNLTLEDKSQGMKTEMRDLRLDSQNARVFDDGLLFSGKDSFSIAELSVLLPMTAPMVMKNMAYITETPVQGEFMDIKAKMGVESVVIEEERIGPMHFDFSFNHFHTRTLADLSKELMELYRKPELLQDEEAMMADFVSLFQKHGEALLKYDPVFILDRVSYASPQGNVNFNSSYKLVGATVDEIMNNPMMLLMKLEMEGELSVTEPLLLETLTDPFLALILGLDSTGEGLAAADPDAAEADKTIQYKQMLAMFEQQGYVTREGELLNTKVEYKVGQTLVNGKPFMPGQ